MEDEYNRLLIKGYSEAIIKEIKNIKVLPSSGIWWLRFENRINNKYVKREVSKIVKEKTRAIVSWESDNTAEIKL